MKTNDPELIRESIIAQEYYEKGMEHIMQKHFELAIVSFSKSIDISKHILNKGAYLNRGAAYLQIGMYQEAINDYTCNILNIHNLLTKEESIFRYTNLGYSYYKIGNYTNAKKCYKKVLNLDFNNADALEIISQINIRS